ncbi:Receptor-like proteiny region transmembrane domain- and RING domain-containing protein 4 [Nymphaea thermarum]|nr:Receptor-like proteiny region transmembrane domain- and RING domain-containing protein 4 [Nymphaea thermarum]
MGAGCSKVDDSVCGRRKSTVFQSCLKGFSCSAHSFHVRDQRKERCGIRWRPFRRRAKRQLDGIKGHNCVKGDGLRSIPITEINSGVGFDGWVQENAPSTEFVDESNSGRFPSTTEPLGSSNLLSRRLNVIPDHGRTVLNKETSLGSSEACSVLSNGPEISSSFAACREGGLESRSGVLPEDNSCSSSTFPLVEPSNGVVRDVDSSCGEPKFANSASVVQERGPVLAIAQDGEGHSSIALSETSRSGSSLSHLGTTSGEQRRPCRRTGTLEAAGDGIQFGRTLSVGRLRDRVLRRNASSRGSFNHVANDDMYRDVRQGTVRQILDHATEEIINQRAENPQTSSNYNVINSDSSVRSTNNSHQFRLNNQQAGADVNNNTPPLHRSTFIERRQRVRSQAMAVVGAELVLGQRILKTNQALEQVLDEIHQQSVVSSSRPSVSSFGSVPAPKEDVERLPLKLYTRSCIKNEEAAQCHICLVEYEEGDWMRILRCQHEFHQSCVDKWLKEVHRVCPLCRTNICLSDSLPLERVDSNASR